MVKKKNYVNFKLTKGGIRQVKINFTFNNSLKPSLKSNSICKTSK